MPTSAEMLLKQEADFAHEFTPATLARGRDYYQQGRVQALDTETLSDKHWRLFGQVYGAETTPYEVEIDIRRRRNTSLQIGTSCSCPVGIQCKHGAALLYAWLAHNAGSETALVAADQQVDARERKHRLDVPGHCATHDSPHIARLSERSPAPGEDSLLQQSEWQERLAPPLAMPDIREDIAPRPVLRLYAIKSPHFFPDPTPDGRIRFVDIDFDYATTCIPATNSSPIVTIAENGNSQRVRRQRDQEAQWLAQLPVLKSIADVLPWFSRNQYPDYGLTFTKQHDWLDFFARTLPALHAAGWHIEGAKQHGISLHLIDELDLQLDESPQQDWLDLSLGFEADQRRVDLLPLLREHLHDIDQLPDDAPLFLPADSKGKRYYQLPVARAKAILQTLTELYEQPLDRKGRLRLPRNHAFRLSDLPVQHWRGGDRLRQAAEQIRQHAGIAEVLPPPHFQATLRPYQQTGLNWLQFLRENDLGGILADDMGLGKTVQTLAHLAVEKASGRLTQPALILAPTSLMANWRHEAARFAPALRVLVVHGAQRKKDFAAIAQHDLVLTTYPLLVRDIEVLRKQHWHLLILDEAQVVKNPRSKAAQLARTLNANHRLCLTGTPMENHLGELWALMDFLMPRLLGDETSFRKRFRKPIEEDGDELRQHALQRRIAPFLLRRRKEDVATELPDKIDVLRTLTLTGKQHDLYESVRIAMQEKVRSEIERKGLNQSQIIVLDALLKLRQVCCDPRLVKLAAAKSVTESVKLEYLSELLPSLIEEGRRILLFSQFTEMLVLIEKMLNDAGIAYLKLTGNTKDRETPVRRFQNNEVPLFLISLKAGGVGLNLTAADTVIHYDPWWNPAAENQATDRAHRIGQTKKVFVYKLVTEHTVEEKILALQERKQALADGLYSGNSSQETVFTAEDLAELLKPLRA